MTWERETASSSKHISTRPGPAPQSPTASLLPSTPQARVAPHAQPPEPERTGPKDYEANLTVGRAGDLWTSWARLLLAFPWTTSPPPGSHPGPLARETKDRHREQFWLSHGSLTSYLKGPSRAQRRLWAEAHCLCLACFTCQFDTSQNHLRDVSIEKVPRSSWSMGKAQPALRGSIPRAGGPGLRFRAV